MDWVLITVGVIFFVCIIVGICQGALRIAVSLATTLLTLTIVFFATPHVAKAIAQYTPMDGMIEQKVSAAILDAARTQLGLADGLAGAEEGDDGEDDGEGEEGQGSMLDNMELPRDLQQEAIQAADMPDIFKNLLSVNNNSEIYEELGVQTFAQYVGSYLAKLIINIISYLGTFLIVTIILRAIIFALDIVAEIPVFGLINRLAGGVIGFAGAMIIVWLLFVAVTLLYTTVIGKDIYQAIQGNGILKFLYDNNPIMKMAAKV